MKNKFVLLLACVLIAFFCACAVLPAFADEGEEGAKQAVPEFSFLKMPDLQLPVSGPHGVKQQIAVGISLEVRTAEMASIKGMTARLMDAYTTDLYGYLGAGNTLMTSDGVDVGTIRSRLAVVTDNILGPGKIRSIVVLQAIRNEQ